MKHFRLLFILIGLVACFYFFAGLYLHNQGRSVNDKFIFRVFGGISVVKIITGRYDTGGFEVLFRIEEHDLARAVKTHGLRQKESFDTFSVINTIDHDKIADFDLNALQVQVYRSTRRIDGVERIDLCYDPKSKHALVHVLTPAL